MDAGFPSGGFVQRVDIAAVAGRDALLLRLRVLGETLYLLVVAGRDGGVCLPLGEARETARHALRSSEERPKEVRFRALLDGAKVVVVGAQALVLQREDKTFFLDAHDREITLAQYPEGREVTPLDRQELAARAESVVAGLAGASLGAAKEGLLRAVSKSTTRIERRITAIRGDLARIAEADKLAARAQLFVAEASRAVRGAKVLKVSDWSTGEAVEVELPLDPARSAREQIDAMFKRARRLKEGARIGEARLAEATSMRARLVAIGAQAREASELAALAELASLARAIAPKDFRVEEGATKAVRRKQRDEPRPPYRTFGGEAGAKILVGRGAEHNDTLTFRVGRPHDLWLHAKGHTGAHVVVPLSKGMSCPAELLVDAAHLAAHFSEAKDELVTEVQYTPRRYLRKPRGSAPGLVMVDREKVIVLRREAARLARLLASEVVGP